MSCGLAGLRDVEYFGRRRIGRKRLERDWRESPRIVLKGTSECCWENRRPNDAAGTLDAFGAAGVRGGGALVPLLADRLEGKGNVPDLGSEKAGDENESPQGIHGWKSISARSPLASSVRSRLQ